MIANTLQKYSMQMTVMQCQFVTWNRRLNSIFFLSPKNLNTEHIAEMQTSLCRENNGVYTSEVCPSKIVTSACDISLPWSGTPLATSIWSEINKRARLSSIKRSWTSELPTKYGSYFFNIVYSKQVNYHSQELRIMQTKTSYMRYDLLLS